MNRALVHINPHDPRGPIILDDYAHLIVDSRYMTVEVHLCFAELAVITAADGTLTIEGCECGADHQYQTAKEYLDAAERQHLTVDYI